MEQVAAARKALFALLCLAPVCVAQTPVSECRTQCHPTDADVNGLGPKRDGPLHVILYAHSPEIGGGRLSTLPPVGEPNAAYTRGFDGTQPIYSASWQGDHYVGQAARAAARRPLEIRVAAATAYVYVSVGRDHMDAGVLANVHLESTLELGGMPGSTRLVGVGSTPSLTLFSPQVYEVAIPMALNVTTWTAEDFGRSPLWWDVWLRPETAPAQGYASGLARVHVGPALMPRLVLNTTDAFALVDAYAFADASGQHARALALTTFGSHDFNVTPTFRIEGPSPIDPRFVAPNVSVKALDHSGHFALANVTWDVDFATAGAAPGTYTLHGFLRNEPGTFELAPQVLLEFATPRAASSSPTAIAAMAALIGLVAGVRIGRRDP